MLLVFFSIKTSFSISLRWYSWERNLKFIREYSLWSFLFGISVNSLASLPIIILSWFGYVLEASLLGAAMSLNRNLIRFKNIFGGYISPVFSRLIHDSELAGLKKLVVSSTNLFLSLYSLGLLSLYFIMPFLINMWFDSHVKLAYQIYILALFVHIPMFLSGLNFSIIAMSNQLKQLAVGYFIMSVCMVVLSVPLVYFFGFYGALLGYLALNCGYLLYSSKIIEVNYGIFVLGCDNYLLLYPLAGLIAVRIAVLFIKRFPVVSFDILIGAIGIFTALTYLYRKRFVFMNIFSAIKNKYNVFLSRVQ
jgi:O-antigen/teichoic acid export membrane protein